MKRVLICYYYFHYDAFHVVVQQQCDVLHVERYTYDSVFVE